MLGVWATYKANANYFLETPVKGEIDYFWQWITGSQSRDGYYRVDLYDVAYTSCATGGSGSGVPTRTLGEAGDSAFPLGEITVSDVATVKSNYGKRFGSPFHNPPP